MGELQQPVQFRGQVPPQPLETAEVRHSVGQDGWQAQMLLRQTLPAEHTSLPAQLVGQLAELPLHT